MSHDGLKQDKAKEAKPAASAPAFKPRAAEHAGMGAKDVVAACNFEDGGKVYKKGQPMLKVEAHWSAQGLVSSLAEYQACEDELEARPKSRNAYGSARVHKSK